MLDWWTWTFEGNGIGCKKLGSWVFSSHSNKNQILFFFVLYLSFGIGSSEFYYSGKKMPDGSIVGKYKMAGRNATGTFTFQNAGKGPTPVAAKST